MLRQRWSAKPLAALALRLHPDHCHWLDYLGSLEQLPRAITAARAFAQKRQLPLKALVSDCVAASFAQQGAQVQSSEIAIPTNAVPSDAVSSANAWLGRLWLMGGGFGFYVAELGCMAKVERLWLKAVMTKFFECEYYANRSAL